MADLDQALLLAAETYLREKLDAAPVERITALQNDLERAIFKRLVFQLVRERVGVSAQLFLGADPPGGETSIGLTWQEPDKAQISVLAVDVRPFVALRDLYRAADKLLPTKDLPCQNLPPETVTPSRSQAKPAVTKKARKLASASGPQTMEKPTLNGSRKKPSTRAQKSATRRNTRKES